MKKIYALLLCLVICFALAACGGQQQEQAQQDQVQQESQQQEQQADSGVLESNDCTARILGAEKYTDANGEDAAAVSVKFTNDSSEPLYFNQVFAIKLFQNGIEQYESESFPGEGYDWDSFYTQIKDGATITVYQHKPLANTADPVEIQVSSFDGQSTSVTLELE